MKNGKGFTLIELLLVLAIIGILTTFLMANFLGVKARARDAQRKSDLRQIQAALEQYRADQGIYPLSLSCGGALQSPDGTTVYMEKIPCDPLSGAPYIYNANTTGPTAGTTYTLTACLENGNDPQIDIKNGLLNNAKCTPGTWSYTLSNP